MATTFRPELFLERRRALFFCTALGLLSAAGCSTDGLDPDEVEQESDLSSQRSERSALDAVPAQTDPRRVADAAPPTERDAGAPAPGGPARDPRVSIKGVTANGTGCPAGTWDVVPTADGRSFQLRLAEYDTTATPTTSIDVEDCNLALEVEAPSDVSYSLQSLRYEGFAWLEPGLRATLTSTAYFQGNPAASSTARSVLAGPHDDTYGVTQEIAPADRQWSPCGSTRDLNVVSRLHLDNTQAKGSAYVDVGIVLGIQLDVRSCRP